MDRYQTECTDVTVIGGKLISVNKGIAFCKGQLVDAARAFKDALSGSGFENSLNIQDTIRGDDAGGVNGDFNHDVENDDDSVEYKDKDDDTDDTDSNLPNTDQI